MKNIDKRHYKGIGHKLKPVVTIAGAGLTDNIMAELDRALNDHELIKIKCNGIERDSKTELIATVCSALKAEAVQSIGGTALLLRKSAKANPKLSNLIRPL
ncbi:MAG: YhbY family RNA-binding protein [Proteobacteria bacterium]|jgi:RNA-binding protein|nr:YhbY family RNA-binding protein [Pseudomonadota bacterium]